MDEADWVRSIRRGETEYMDLLIKRHYPSIQKYCYWKTGNAEAAQDLTQETFYRFFRYFHSYTHAGKLRAYLYTIARRLCSEHFKQGQTLPLEEAEKIHRAYLSMEEQIEGEQHIRQLLGSLAPDQQEILLLRFVHDMKFREIAEVTGLNLCLVQYKARRGLAVIRKEMERGGAYEQTNRTSAHSKTSSVASNSPF